MKSLHRFILGRALMAGLLFGALGLAPVPANALPTFWDREDFGFGTGWGVTQTTANAAGVPIVNAPTLATVPITLAVNHSLDQSTLGLPVPLGSGPATITANWTATNNTGVAIQNAFLVFARPVTNDQHAPPVTYAPADVGLALGANWVILKVDANGIPVYYPAVSLGNLANGATAAFPLFYSLNNPQVFDQPFNDELGMPKWNLAFLTGTPIPEPSTALLVVMGLVGIAGARRKPS